MAGFDRYEHILRLFTEHNSSWSVPDVAQNLGASVSTTYRTMRELQQAGFLEHGVNSKYRLGPAFIEFEHRLHSSDPLVQAGETLLKQFVAEVEEAGIAVLARLYNGQVMCVADVRRSDFDAQTSYERGRPMPIFSGATSKVILAGLTARERDRLFRQLGKDAPSPDIVPELEAIRKIGSVVAQGEVDANLLGVAVPVRHKGFGIRASFSYIMHGSADNLLAAHRMIAPLTEVAKRIESEIETAYQTIESADCR